MAGMKPAGSTVTGFPSMSDAHSPYRPLADYALIGDGHTAALVSPDGSIDWLCAPSFDSPSILARLLDARRGGYFAVQPEGRFESHASYLGYSAAVKTSFRSARGAAALVDFMPLVEGDGAERFGMPRAERRVVRGGFRALKTPEVSLFMPTLQRRRLFWR